MKIQFLKALDRWLGAALVRLLPAPRLVSPPSEPRSFLLIRPGGIGDAVLLAPAIRLLRERFPKARIDVLAERRNAGVFDLVPGINSVFHYDNPRQLARVLCRHYDLVIDSEQWHRLSAVVACLVGAPVKIGFASNERSRLFTHSIGYDLDRYEVLSFLDLLAPIGIQPSEVAPSKGVVVPEKARHIAAELLKMVAHRPLLVLFAGASIPEKRWDKKNFRILIDAGLARGFAVAMVGGPGDVAVNESAAAGRDVLNLAGQTRFAETAAVLEQAACVVSGDSGVLHLAAALDRPIVALFGPSNPCKWGPRGARQIILQTTPACSPCSKFGYTPPCNQNIRCLAELTPSSVIAAIDDLLYLKIDRET